MSKISKGPWHVYHRADRNLINCGYVQIRSDEEKNATICEMGGFGTGHDKNIANATLMAAAPEMLEALEALKEWMHLAGLAPFEVANKMHNAIRKAKGEKIYG